MMFYVENPKEYIIKLPGLISQLSKITRYKTDIQKSIVFLYSRNEQWELEISMLLL